LQSRSKFIPVRNKKRVKFTKYQVFKHTTESKKRNMVGTNPEVQKRKGLQAALNPTYTTTTTEKMDIEFSYSVVSKPAETGDKNKEPQKPRSNE